MKSRLVLAVAAIAASVVPAWAQDAVEAAARARAARIERALTAIRQRQPQQALAILDPLLVEYDSLYKGERRRIFCGESPTETVAYAGMRGKGANARDVIVIERGWCLSLWAKGYVLIDMGRIADAVPFLERAVAMAPFHAHYLSELGYAYQAQRDWKRSLDTYRRAAAAAEGFEQGDERNRQLRRAWMGISFAHVELGNLDEAEKWLRRCLQLDPKDENARREMEYIRQQRAGKI